LRDFTLKTYSHLLRALNNKRYRFTTFDEYLNNYSSLFTSHSLLCILRHDVDRSPNNALKMAEIEKELGITGTYYFRIVPESFDVEIIKQIAEMGYEIGYHYEEMSSPLLVSPKGGEISLDERMDRAWELFKENLERIRKVAEVKTICPHGSPLSPFSNQHIWDKYDYKELGITGDAHLDTNWDEVGYFTDTGRRWDGDSVSVRDKAPSSVLPPRGRKFKSTFDIIQALENDQFPQKVMINVHPERWNDNIFWWTEELISQNIKNVIKKHFFVKR